MIIDGKKIAEEMLAEIKEAMALRRVRQVHRRQAQGESLRLAAVLVGENASSRKFLELKKKTAERIGIDFRLYEFPTDITTQKLRKEVVSIAKAGVNQGVLVELPLPEHINTQYVLNAIPQEKDVDVLSEKSQEAFFVGRSAILPPAVEAVKIIFSAIGGPAYGGEEFPNLKGKLAAVFGYGLLVGKPVSHWLAQQGATVSIINEFTSSPAELSCQADIIISGVGKPNLIIADMVKDGAVVIDFGYNQSSTVNVVGDIEFNEVSKKAGWITPVPGGVGPIVIAAVLKNLLALYKK